MSYIGKNIVINTETLTPLNADPSNPTTGMIYCSNGTPRAAGLWEWNGTAWVLLGGGGLLNVYHAATAAEVTIVPTQTVAYAGTPFSVLTGYNYEYELSTYNGAVQLPTMTSGSPNNSSIRFVGMDNNGTSNRLYIIPGGTNTITVNDVTFTQAELVPSESWCQLDWDSTNLTWRPTSVSGSINGTFSGSLAVTGTLTVAGLLTPSSGIAGNTSGSAAAAGTIGEVISASLAGNSVSSPSMGTWYDDTGTLTLTAGNWSIYCNVGVQGNNPGSMSAGAAPIVFSGIRTGSTVLTFVGGAIAQTSGNVFGDTNALSAVVNISTSTTYKISIKWGSTSGSPTLGSMVSQNTGGGSGSFYAIRIS